MTDLWRKVKQYKHTKIYKIINIYIYRFFRGSGFGCQGIKTEKNWIFHQQHQAYNIA